MAKTLVKPSSYILTVFFTTLVAAMLVDGIKPVSGNEAEYGAFVDVDENSDQKPVERVWVQPQQHSPLVRRPIPSRRGGPVGRDCTFWAYGFSCSQCDRVCKYTYHYQWGACKGLWPTRTCVCHKECNHLINNI